MQLLRPAWGWLIFFALVLLFCLWMKWPFFALFTLSVVVLTFVPKVRAFFIKQHSLMGKMGRNIFDWTFVFLVSLAIVLVLKSYFVDVFRLPSNSMEKTLNNGDIVLINKLMIGPRIHPDNPDKYYRACGYSSIHRGDLIVFNFPEGDTLLVNRYFESYYSIKRKYGHMAASQEEQFLGERAYKSVTRRPKYIKRVIALPGDTLVIKNGVVMVNGEAVQQPETSVSLFVDTVGNGDALLQSLQVKPYNQYVHKNQTIYELMHGVFHQHPELKRSFAPFILPVDNPDPHVFPYNCVWNTDNYGPLVMPAKGATVQVDASNIELYARIIDVYEDNDLMVKDGLVYINGKKETSYTFKMNYYWMMGDNHPHSFDSRYWGFLPENHVIGVSPVQFQVFE